MDFQDLSNLIKTRRSIRKFEDKPVPEDLLLKALELATWAPNGGNFQPWRFVIIQNKGMIEKMADAVKARTEQMGSWPEANQFGETVKRWQRNADFFRNAPVCTAVLMGKYVSVADQILKSRGENDPVAREVRSSRQIGNSSLQSVAAAITYLLLILHQFGLGSTWVACLAAHRTARGLGRARFAVEATSLLTRRRRGVRPSVVSRRMSPLLIPRRQCRACWGERGEPTRLSVCPTLTRHP